MAEIKPAEISAILRKQLSGFKDESQLEEIGTVLSQYFSVLRSFLVQYDDFGSPLREGKEQSEQNGTDQQPRRDVHIDDPGSSVHPEEETHSYDEDIDDDDMFQAYRVGYIHEEIDTDYHPEGYFEIERKC